MADGPLKFVGSLAEGNMAVENISRFGRDFSVVRIPYSFKLLIQELQVMNVQMRIITDDNVDQLLSMSYSNNINKLLQVGNKELKDVVKEYSQNMNTIVYKENNTNINKQNQQKEIPSIPEPVILEYEKVIEPETPQFESPPYAPNSPQFESQPYASNSPNIEEFKKISIENISDSSSGNMPSLEQPTLPLQNIVIENKSITPNLEVKPSILEVETPKEDIEVKKEESEDKSETKKVSISDESVESNSEDSKKITF
jgi:DNA-directed RNA polymerase II subunit RPB2